VARTVSLSETKCAATVDPVGLAADLGYSYSSPKRLHRLVQAFAASQVGGWLTPKTLVPLDKLVTRLSKGRVSESPRRAGRSPRRHFGDPWTT
jgi:hypothetical protein